MPADQTVESAVAALVRGVRKEHSLTRDAVATAARKYGLTWSTGSVGNLETGKMSMTLSALVILAQVLHDLTGEPFTLADLLGDADTLQLTPSATAPEVKWRAALSGQPVSIDLPAPEPSGALDSGSSFKKALDALGGVGQRSALAWKVWQDSGLAEERASATLGISTGELALFSAGLWGTTLSAERDRRTGPDASAQKRGHVTRQLIEEIHERLMLAGDEVTGKSKGSTDG